MTERTWIKVTAAQKEAWLLAEEGSFEDSNSSRNHVYYNIKGSYKTSIYIDRNCIEALVSSLVLSTFSDHSPRLYKAVATKMIEACKEMNRLDLVSKIEAN